MQNLSETEPIESAVLEEYNFIELQNAKSDPMGMEPVLEECNFIELQNLKIK